MSFVLGWTKLKGCPFHYSMYFWVHQTVKTTASLDKQFFYNRHLIFSFWNIHLFCLALYYTRLWWWLATSASELGTTQNINLAEETFTRKKKSSHDQNKFLHHMVTSFSMQQGHGHQSIVIWLLMVMSQVWLVGREKKMSESQNLKIWKFKNLNSNIKMS